jgi:phospholipid/cholesterol/gamma-HCH transport system permease protein
MGLNVAKFLIAPKVLAILIAMPILTILAFVMGVAGGFVLGIFALGFTFDRWWQQTIQAVSMNDLMQGFLKSFVFALIIVIVGCYNGLKVTGGARGVGISTTRAVVMDIFFIVVADLVFASLFYITS